MCGLTLYFLLLFNKVYVCVGFYYKFYVFFYYKFILMEKFIKYNQVNYSYCDVRYLNLHCSLGFLKNNFIVDEFCFSLLYTMIIDLFN